MIDVLPAVTLATVKDPVKLPAERVQDCDTTEPPDKLQEVSLREKPDPDTVTLAPISAEEGLKKIDAPLIAKGAEAESPYGLPVTVIVYAAGVIDVMLNDADNTPFEIEQLEAPTGEPDS